MNGPQHYREAEKLIDEATKDAYGTAAERYFLAVAQIHATLALAAATADPYGNEEHWKAVLT